MKLLYCPTCHDIYNIKHEPKTCLCGATSGMYRSDGLTVDVGGDDVICTAMKYNIESSTLEENLLYDGEDH